LCGAKCDLLLYDLTSTYFEGQAGEIPAARRGYSRDSRPDALQLILAMVVTEEGLPLSYEVFEGNRADVTTLEEILDSVERKHGKLAESGSSIAGLSVKRILTCCVPEVPPIWWPLRNDF
jgi:transposase